MELMLYYFFSGIVHVVLICLHLFALFTNKKKIKSGVALLPYYPVEWPGGNRTAAFQKYFQRDGINCDVFPAWNKVEIEYYLKNEKSSCRYWIYLKLLCRRVYFFRKINTYEAVWVQRAFVPMFPFKKACFEKMACTVHKNICYDFYDADYESNYGLVMETVKIANKVTVASKYLKDKFIVINPETYFVRFSVDTEKYILKKDVREGGKLRIGWMGSPQNAANLRSICEQLQKVEKEYPNAFFSFVSREVPDLGLKSLEHLWWNKPGFDYYNWLAGLDIGIVPFLDQTERVKAKISMKSLEFMVAKIPQIVSPNVHSDMVVSNESCIVANSDDWYNSICTLLKNKKLRDEMADNAYRIYYQYHSYFKIYDQIKNILLVEGVK